MKIGIAKEKAAGGLEVRVALLPPEAERIIKAGHKVFVEKDAGEGVYISDSEYKAKGAVIKKDPAEIYNKDIVVKLKPPTPEEFALLGGNIIFSMLHIPQNPRCLTMLKKSKAKAVAMEAIAGENGERLISCTDMAGEQGMLLAFNHALKSPRECSVLVLGYGAIASGALSIAYSLGAKVKILRRQEHKFIRHHLKNKDIVVNGISWPKQHRDKKDYLVTRKMLSLLNKGATILDLAVDYPGPIETTRATFLDDPFYFVDGVKHICIYGYPGLSPISSSERYSRQILPILLEIARGGLKKAPPYIKKAVYAP